MKMPRFGQRRRDLEAAERALNVPLYRPMYTQDRFKREEGDFALARSNEAWLKEREQYRAIEDAKGTEAAVREVTRLAKQEAKRLARKLKKQSKQLVRRARSRDG